MVIALSGNRQRGGFGGGRSPAAASGRQTRVATDADRGKPDLSLRAIMAELAGDEVKGSYGALWAFFARQGITFKKSLHASEQSLPRGPSAHGAGSGPRPT